MTVLKVSIIGTGGALEFLHYPSLISLPSKYNIHSILERTPRGRVQEICGQGVKAVTEITDILEDVNVDLVVVASANKTHFEYTKLCLQAGKHVLVEKPLCPTSTEAQTLVDLAKSRNLILSVYQNRRWDSDFLTLQHLLETNKLGHIQSFHSAYDRYRPLPPNRQVGYWKESPGENNDVIYALGTHTIDQVYILFGVPKRVYARMWDVRGIGVDESMHVEMYYPSRGGLKTEMVVTCTASVLSPMPRQLRFQVKGVKGTYTKYGLDMQGDDLKELGRKGRAGEIQVGKEGKDAVEGYGVEDEASWGEMWSTEGDGERVMGQDGVEFVKTRVETIPGDYPALYANLYDAIINKDPTILSVKPEEAVVVLKLIELAKRSSAEGQVLHVDF